MVLGKSRQAHQRTQSFRFPSESSLINHSTLLVERSSAKLLVFTIMHSNTRQALNASTRSVYAKWYWVIHGTLTIERKIRFPSLLINHSTLLLERSSAELLVFITIMHSNTRQALNYSERVDAFGRRAVEVIICMITRDFSVISIDVRGVSLSLSLSLSQKSLTHNIGSASALPIIFVTQPYHSSTYGIKKENSVKISENFSKNFRKFQ